MNLLGDSRESCSARTTDEDALGEVQNKGGCLCLISLFGGSRNAPAKRGTAHHNFRQERQIIRIINEPRCACVMAVFFCFFFLNRGAETLKGFSNEVQHATIVIIPLVVSGTVKVQM